MDQEIQARDDVPDTFASHACRSCGISTGGCCKSSFVPITFDDIKEIVSLGYDAASFVIAREYSEDDFAGDEPWYRESAVRIDGRPFRLNLRQGKDSNCIFLKPGEGCTLNEHRPYACKIFPFWLDSSGRVAFATEGIHCEIEKHGLPVPQAVAAVHETETAIEHYYACIRKDFVENKEAHSCLIKELCKASIDAAATQH